MAPRAWTRYQVVTLQEPWEILCMMRIHLSRCFVGDTDMKGGMHR